MINFPFFYLQLIKLGFFKKIFFFSKVTRWRDWSRFYRMEPKKNERKNFIHIFNYYCGIYPFGYSIRKKRRKFAHNQINIQYIWLQIFYHVLKYERHSLPTNKQKKKKHLQLLYTRWPFSNVRKEIFFFSFVHSFGYRQRRKCI